MARHVLTTVVDDIDGTPAEHTVEFGLDRAIYEIDLSPANAERLRHALQPYLSNARCVAGAPVMQPPRASIAAEQRRPARIDPEQLRAMRRWAAAHGFQVPPRGRIPASVLDAYNQAPVGS